VQQKAAIDNYYSMAKGQQAVAAELGSVGTTP